MRVHAALLEGRCGFQSGGLEGSSLRLHRGGWCGISSGEMSSIGSTSMLVALARFPREATAQARVFFQESDSLGGVERAHQ